MGKYCRHILVTCFTVLVVIHTQNITVSISTKDVGGTETLIDRKENGCNRRMNRGLKLERIVSEQKYEVVSV